MPALKKPSIPQNDNVAHALAGAGGGILSMILTYPLITLSTRAQVESTRASTGFLAAVQHIVAREGVSGLYAGLDSALFGISVTNFVYYYWYEWSRAFFEAAAAARAGLAPSPAGPRRLTAIESMMAGALAGSATVILTNPIWVVNTRMTTRKRSKKEDLAAVQKPVTAPESTAQEKPAKDQNAETTSSSTANPSTTSPTADADATPQATPSKVPSKLPPDSAALPTTTIGTLLHLLRHEGPQALFSGVVPALVLVINPILQYTLFEQLKGAVERRRRVTPGIAFLLGALGKLVATAVTYPYITVKSRMHVRVGREEEGEGVVRVLGRVVREEGYGGLYRGIGPKLAQSVLTAAFLFAFKDMLYEQTVHLRMRGRVSRQRALVL